MQRPMLRALKQQHSSLQTTPKVRQMHRPMLRALKRRNLDLRLHPPRQMHRPMLRALKPLTTSWVKSTRLVSDASPDVEGIETPPHTHMAH